MQINSILIHCNNDYEGKVVANLISTKEKSSNTAIVHIHGFSDYFFHNHLAKEINEAEIDFYSLELRKYGRSKLIHQHEFYFKEINEYYEEISKSIEILVNKGYQKIHFMGHSTGGLIVSMYAFEGELKHKITSLVLNSPLLNLPIKGYLKKAVSRVSFLLKVFPYFKIKDNQKPSIGSIYNDSLHKDYKGEWDYFRQVKETNSSYLSWINGVENALKILQKGLELTIPILILHSNKTFFSKKWDDRLLTSDMILKVNDMKKVGPTLGNKVTLQEIKDGMHDIYLSKLAAREEAISKTISWLKII